MRCCCSDILSPLHSWFQTLIIDSDWSRLSHDCSRLFWNFPHLNANCRKYLYNNVCHMSMGVNSLAPLRARPPVHPNVIKRGRLTSLDVGVVDSEPGNISLHSVAWKISLVLAVFVWTTKTNADSPGSIMLSSRSVWLKTPSHVQLWPTLETIPTKLQHHAV